MPTYTSTRPTLPPDTALAKALPELKAAELKLRKNASQHGITYAIAEFGGMRTQGDTTKAMTYRDAEYAIYVKQMKAAGKTPLPINTWRPIAQFGSSYHNYGAAFDVWVESVPSGRTQAWGLAMMQNAATAVGLRSGVSFNDPPHFELPITLADARARWAKLTGQVVTAPTTAPKGTIAVGALLALAALAGLVAFALHRKGSI